MLVGIVPEVLQNEPKRPCLRACSGDVRGGNTPSLVGLMISAFISSPFLALMSATLLEIWLKTHHIYNATKLRKGMVIKGT